MSGSTTEAEADSKNVNVWVQQSLPPPDLQVYVPFIGLNSQGEEAVFEALVSSSSRLSDFVFHINTEETHTMTETEMDTTVTVTETMSDNAVREEQDKKQEQEYDDEYCMGYCDVNWLDYKDDEDYDDGDYYMGEEDYDDDEEEEEEEEEEGDEEAVRPASEESIMGLEVVRIEQGSVGLAGEDCAVCLDEFSIGSEARRMPCSHIYHQDCIVLWLGKSNLCPICRYRLP